MKIVLYGCCSFPYFFRHLVTQKPTVPAEIDWRVVLLSWRHHELFRDSLPADHLFYVHPPLNELIKKPLPRNPLSAMPISLYKTIATDKGEWGQLRTRSRRYKERNAMAYYTLYKGYLQRERPDAVLIPMIETHDAMIFLAVAQELGIQTVLANAARNLRTSFFSATENEDIPPYAWTENLSAAEIEEARSLLSEFRSKPVPAFPMPEESDLRDQLDLPRPLGKWAKLTWRLPVTLRNLWRDMVHEPHAARSNPFLYNARVHWFGVTTAVRRTKGRWRHRYFDLKRIEDLPERFIYFPLQVTPESSINTLSPYFVDQKRAIDLILLNMPSDHLLLIKEHPVMVGERPSSFYAALRREAGARLVSADVPSLELIRRSSMTVAITGTAALEALLLGKPSLLLGTASFKPWVTAPDSWEDIRGTIRRAIDQTPAAIDEKAVDCIARTRHVGYPYILFDPYNLVFDPKYIMSRGNLQRFLDGFLDHLRRLKNIKS